MTRYETLLVTVPEITAGEAAALEGSVEKLLAEHKASLISFERWGKYHLAYPLSANETNEYGVYFLTRFESAQEDSLKNLLGALDTLMSVKYNELVMRHMNTRLGTNSALSYHRPESLEETPSRDVETFLKESKMTGLLNQRSEQSRGPERRDSFKQELDEIDDENDDTLEDA